MIPIPTPNFRVEIIIPCDSPDIVSILSDHVEWINGYQYNKLWRRSLVDGFPLHVIIILNIYFNMRTMQFFSN